MNPAFWDMLARIIATSTVVIDRPRGTAHPRYPGFIYRVDYGYLSGTSSMDGNGIDVWRGTDETAGADAIICTVDLTKMDSEIKILLNCTGEEKQLAYQTHNETECMKGLLIRRSDAL